MSNIVEPVNPSWLTVNQIEKGEKIRGGVGNIINQSVNSLVHRTAYNRKANNDLSIMVTSHISNNDLHRIINDAGTSTTELWSADKINTLTNDIDDVIDNNTVHYYIKGSNYTIVDNHAFIFADTTTIEWILMLPFSPAIGDSVEINDLAASWDDKNLTVSRNGQLINGLAEDLICDIKNCAVKLVYSNTTYGWKAI